MNFNLMSLTMTKASFVETTHASFAGVTQSGGGETSGLFLEKMHQLLKDNALDRGITLPAGKETKDVLKDHMKQSLLKDMMNAEGTAFLDKLQQYLNVSGYDLKHSTVKGEGLQAIEDMLVKAGFSRGDVQGLVEDLTAESGEDGIIVSDLMEGLFSLEKEVSANEDSDSETDTDSGEKLLDTSALPFISSLFDLLGIPESRAQTLISESERKGEGFDVQKLIEGLQTMQEEAFFTGTSFEVKADNSDLLTQLDHLDIDQPADGSKTFTLGDFVSALEKMRTQGTENDGVENESGLEISTVDDLPVPEESEVETGGEGFLSALRALIEKNRTDIDSADGSVTEGVVEMETGGEGFLSALRALIEKNRTDIDSADGSVTEGVVEMETDNSKADSFLNALKDLTKKNDNDAFSGENTIGLEDESSGDDDLLKALRKLIIQNETTGASSDDNDNSSAAKESDSNDILSAVEKLISKRETGEVVPSVESRSESGGDDADRDNFLTALLNRINGGTAGKSDETVKNISTTESVGENKDSGSDGETLLSTFIKNLKSGEKSGDGVDKILSNEEKNQSFSIIQQSQEKTLMEMFQFQGLSSTTDSFLSTDEFTMSDEFIRMAERMDLMVSGKNNDVKAIESLERDMAALFARSDKKELISGLETTSTNNGSTSGNGMKDNALVSGSAKPSALLPSYVTLQVGKSIIRAANRGESELKLQLKPVELGRLTMTIDAQGDSLKISVITENQAAKDILMSHANDLKSTLSANGINIESFDVETGGNFEQSLANSKNFSDGSGTGNGKTSQDNILTLEDEGALEAETMLNRTNSALHFVA